MHYTEIKKPMDLHLRVGRRYKSLILDRPIHKSQKVLKESDSAVQVSLTICESSELLMLLLSYGDGIQVLNPPSYVEYFTKEIKKMSRLYDIK